MDALETNDRPVDDSRRAFLRRMTRAGVAVPVVASFTLLGGCNICDWGGGGNVR